MCFEAPQIKALSQDYPDLVASLLALIDRAVQDAVAGLVALQQGEVVGVGGHG